MKGDEFATIQPQTVMIPQKRSELHSDIVSIESRIAISTTAPNPGVKPDT